MAASLLLISADDSVIYVLRRYAETGGCQLVVSDRGTAAMTAAQAIQPDVIILDIQPGDDDPAGWDTLRLLQDDIATRSVPVIVCGWQDGHAPDDLLEVVAGWLLKPMLYSDFVTAVCSLMDETNPSETPDKPD